MALVRGWLEYSVHWKMSILRVEARERLEPRLQCLSERVGSSQLLAIIPAVTHGEALIRRSWRM